MQFGSISYAIEGAAPQELALRPGVTTLGSAPDNDIVLTDGAIGAYHLRLICTPDTCWLMSLDSENPVFLNYVRVQPGARYPLRDGDVVRIGAYYVRYNRPEPSAADEVQRLIDASRQGSPRRSSAVLPPAVAARLAEVGAQSRRTTRLPARRLRGNEGVIHPPRHLGPSSAYLQYLPPPFQEQEFLGRLLLIFESILDPLDRQIGDLLYYFDPRTAPAALLPWLATWLDLVLNENWPLERRRALILASAELYRYRGTRRGLSDYIRIYTGIRPEIIEPHQATGSEKLPAHVFKVRLKVPDPASIDRQLVERIIQAEKPAHTGYLLEIIGQE